MQWADRFEVYADGEKSAVGSLSDEAMLKRLRNYKRQVAKRYRVVEPEQVERLLTGGPYWISTKLDGELWFLVKKDGEVALCAFNGRVIRKTSLCKEAEKLLTKTGDIVLAGELVAKPDDSGRGRVYHVATALGEAELERTLTFHAFDLVDEGGEDKLLATYAERMERMRALLASGKRVCVVETAEGDTPDVMRLYREWVVSDRFEGVVVRSERGLTYKVKSTLTLDAVVIAYGERITGDVRQMREMSVGLLRDDGGIQLVGAVGTGFSEQDRAAWHARLSKIEVPSRFRLANREGTLSKFVKPEIVVELRVSDLLTTDSWDAPIRRMTLQYEPTKGWSPVLETPTAVMIHPIFLRERTDKTVSVENVGMTQITNYVPLGEEDDDAPVAALEPAQVVRRGVYTKDTKGVIAVRKYAVIDTHKTGDRTYPPIAVFFTDYSPGRKEPLQTTLRAASTIGKAEVIVKEWVTENVKRGWTEHEPGRVGAPVGEAPPPPPAKQTPAKKAPAKRGKKKAESDEPSA
jgi:hypothetical protein